MGAFNFFVRQVRSWVRLAHPDHSRPDHVPLIFCWLNHVNKGSVTLHYWMPDTVISEANELVVWLAGRWKPNKNPPHNTMDMADLPSSDNTTLQKPCCACTIKLFHCAASWDTFSVQTRHSCNLCDGQHWHQLANLFTDHSSKSYVLLDWAVCVVLATSDHTFKRWLQQHGCASCARTNRNSITFVSLGSAVHSAAHRWILLPNVLVSAVYVFCASSE